MASTAGPGRQHRKTIATVQVSSSGPIGKMSIGIVLIRYAADSSREIKTPFSEIMMFAFVVASAIMSSRAW